MNRRYGSLVHEGSKPAGTKAGGDATGNAPAGSPCQDARGTTTRTSCARVRAGMTSQISITFSFHSDGPRYAEIENAPHLLVHPAQNLLEAPCRTANFKVSEPLQGTYA